MKNHSVYPDSVVYIRGCHETPGLFGEVRFYHECVPVLMKAHISGLPQKNSPGFFALHIHEGRDCSRENLSNTKGHNDLSGAPHLGHVGDLPPLMRCNSGTCLAGLDKPLSCEGYYQTHSCDPQRPDDFKSKPAGNIGAKIACGMIQWRQAFCSFASISNLIAGI